MSWKDKYQRGSPNHQFLPEDLQVEVGEIQCASFFKASQSSSGKIH